ncbi:DUF6580 family putative transport protein [Pinibacter aurantiacus]|uniref:Uncharacterized protein n=1 Tax=Pinibacter aurantiacus TaxID=2851599 RepID=A0A9E2W4V8_9BACT|nr:DUF6580 family putative transport protein [Pinibacter aurantiacus]MBV4358234.1 hypothetical protein [Pinibacter aurantiacus]
MSIEKINPRYLTLLVIITVVALIRILTNFSTEMSPLATFTPIGAMALFGGTYFSGRLKPFTLSLLSLFASDVILSLTVYKQYNTGFLYMGWYWTYGAFVLMTLAGKLMVKKVTVLNVLSAAIVCVLIHWIVTDFGVWLDGTMYTKDFQGWTLCMIAAIPYELRFAAGAIVYSALLFGTFEWLQQQYPQLRQVNAVA